MSNEWDQRSNETDEEYAWFLAYLTLGPSRSLPALIAHYGKGVTKRDEKRRLRNGSVEGACSRHHWVKRAGAYDVSLMQAALRTSGAAVIEGLREYAVYFLEVMRRTRIKPQTFGDLVNGVQVLAQLFPPEIIAAVLQSASHGDAGSGGDGESGVSGVSG
jgi:hypothetical protein